MSETLFGVITGVHVLLLVYFLLLNGAYLITTMLSMAVLRRHARRADASDVSDVLTSGAPPITLIAPAFNEEANCVASTAALLSLVYPEYEVLVVNDGSSDATLARLTEAFDLEAVPRAPDADLPSARVRDIYRSRSRSNLWVVDKENGGKADALNAGINYCHTELFCSMDADTLLERDALARVVRPFLEDARTMAAGGIIRIVNDSPVRIGLVEQVRLPRKMLARFQVLEYLRSFLVGRVGWDVIDAMLIISGAFGLFRRSLVVELGGYATDTVGEDMELVVRIHRHCLERKIPYRVSFVPDPVAWTECPETLRVLGRQRDRWQRGLMQVLWRHRVMLLRPKYGRVGMLAFPFFFFLEGWGPLVEIAGYASFVLALILGNWAPLLALAFFVVAFVFGAALSIAAVGLEELSFRRYERWSDLAWLLVVGLLEPFGYRQLSTWWRAKGVISALRGVKGWGAMERRGFKAAATLALLAGAAGSASAQEPAWSARAGYAREVFSSPVAAWSPWETRDVSVGRRFARGAVSAGALHARRFAREDVAGTLDVYRTLWRRAYGNVRVQVAPGADVIARADVAGELFSTFGKWEPSLAFRRMSFATVGVNVASVSLARYHERWFGQVRASDAWSGGLSDGNASVSALLRREIDTSLGYAQVAAGTGGEAVTLGLAADGTSRVEVRRTSFVSAGARKYLSRNVGLQGSLSHVSFEGVPRRAGGALAALVRW